MYLHFSVQIYLCGAKGTNLYSRAVVVDKVLAAMGTKRGSLLY